MSGEPTRGPTGGRVALYFTPPPCSPLARFGEAWLSADNQPTITGLPRHYGFHATLKAPFALAPGRGLQLLERRLAAFAAARGAVPAGRLQVSELSGFIALTLSAPCKAVNELAADCVRDFDDLRAGLSADDVARRQAAGLTARQEAHLRRWGYPYVLEEFRFHMTLTSRLAEPERREWLARLRLRAEPLLAQPLLVDAVSLCAQENRERPFRVIRRYPLGG